MNLKNGLKLFGIEAQIFPVIAKNIELPWYPGYPGSLEKKYSTTRVVKSRVIWKH